MKLDYTRARSTTVVVVNATSLDADNSATFRGAMEDALRAEGDVVVDLDALEFIDSSGLGALLTCLREITARGGEMKLCCVSSPVRAIFDLTRMHRILDIHRDRDAALDALES